MQIYVISSIECCKTGGLGFLFIYFLFMLLAFNSTFSVCRFNFISERIQRFFKKKKKKKKKNRQISFLRSPSQNFFLAKTRCHSRFCIFSFILCFPMFFFFFFLFFFSIFSFLLRLLSSKKERSDL